MSRGVRIVGILLFVLIPVLVLEGTSALYLRVLARNPRPLAERNRQRHLYEAYRGHQLTPSWSFEGTVYDAQGFRRSGDVARQKPAGTFRVFLMGGSAAYGAPAAPPFPTVSLRNDQTIDAKLEQRLGQLAPGRRVEVINAAVTAYWTHQHLIYLLESLLDYDPDLIIFLDGINDHYHTLPDHDQFLSYQYSLPLRVPALNHPTASEVLRTFFSWAKEYSYAAVLLVLRDQGVQAIVAAQPELVFDQTGGRSPEDAKLAAIEEGLRPAHYKEKKTFLRPLANRLETATAADLGATFVDLTDVFDDKAQYFIDYCHLTETGSDRVAERLAPLVVDAMKAHG